MDRLSDYRTLARKAKAKVKERRAHIFVNPSTFSEIPFESLDLDRYAIKIRRKDPGTIEQIPISTCIPRKAKHHLKHLTRLTKQASFAIESSGLYVAGDTGFPLAGMSLIRESWVEDWNPQKRFLDQRYTDHNDEPFTITEPLVIASQPWLQNYYHCLIQALPRVLEAKSLGWLDHKIGVPVSAPRLLQDIIRLHIPTAKFFELPDQLLAGNFLLTSVDTGTPSSGTVANLKSLRTSGETPRKRLFINRGSVSNRKLLNENEVFNLLKKYGFESFDPGQHDVETQKQVFSSAQIVVGVHGAALSNVIYMTPGTVLIELMPANYIVDCFLVLAHHLNVKYHMVLGSEPSIPFTLSKILDPNSHMNDVSANLWVKPSKLENVVQQYM